MRTRSNLVGPYISFTGPIDPTYHEEHERLCFEMQGGLLKLATPSTGPNTLYPLFHAVVRVNADLPNDCTPNQVWRMCFDALVALPLLTLSTVQGTSNRSASARAQKF